MVAAIFRLEQSHSPFGALPEDVQRRLEQAPLAQLEDWIDRFYDAGSLEQVFH